MYSFLRLNLYDVNLLRVVGVLLGSSNKGTVDVTNSFAVPFEEDAKNPSIFFLDHNYLETMYRMHKKVNGAKDKIDSNALNIY